VSVSRDPLDLCPCIRKKYAAFIERAHELGIAVTTIETMRDIDTQKLYVRRGASQTMNSKHLPQKPNGKALAFDAAPTTYLSMKAWNPNGPQWSALGTIGKDLGLGWGGDMWKTFVDKPHFQLTACECVEPK
jgi:peptidoglycan L-alanyl-D-glutamate endopeptidase CwlK